MLRYQFTKHFLTNFRVYSVIKVKNPPAGRKNRKCGEQFETLIHLNKNHFCRMLLEYLFPGRHKGCYAPQLAL